MKRKLFMSPAGLLALLAWAGRALGAGVLYAAGAFFTKEGLERWKSRRKFWY